MLLQVKARPARCPQCGTTRARKLFESRDALSGESFAIQECLRCRLVATHPRPEPAALADYYPRGHQTNAPAAYEVADAGPRVQFLARLRPPGSLLEIGCGKGLVLDGMRRLGWTVVGTELSEASADRARRLGLPVHTRALESCVFRTAEFQVIALFHALEHLSDPLADLTRCRRWLAPDGWLVLEVPNFASWYAQVFRGHWFHLDPPRHLYHFTPTTLRALVQRAGFSVHTITTTQARYDAFGALQSALNAVLRRRNLLNDYLTGQLTRRDLAGGTRWALGVSLLFLGLGFPWLLALAKLLAPFVSGGTIRLTARAATSTPARRPGIAGRPANGSAPPGPPTAARKRSDRR